MIVNDVICLSGCVINIANSLAIEVDKLIGVNPDTGASSKQGVFAGCCRVPVQVVCAFHEPEAIPVKCIAGSGGGH